MADFVIRQGDTSPALVWQLEDANGSPPDLTTATSVVWVMRQTSSNSPSTSSAATVTDATNGVVTYNWSTADTATAGIFTGEFHVTYSSGATQTYPGDGYLEVSVEENLTTAGGATIVSLGDVKEHLQIPSADRTRDRQLLRFIRASVPVIENLVGSVLQTQHEEWYDGGQHFITVRHRPLLTLLACDEYRGPIDFVQNIIASPDRGEIYSVMVDGSRIVRRSAGGGIIAFPAMPQAVHVVYISGRNPIPANIIEANLELLRVNFQGTQNRAAPGYMAAALGMEDAVGPTTPTGFFVPGRVRELLAHHRRHPSVA